jgi:hypothetical protein
MQDWCQEIKKHFFFLIKEYILNLHILSCNLFSFQEKMCEKSLKCDYCDLNLTCVP